MILPVQNLLRARVTEVLRTLYQIGPDEVPSIAIALPPNRAMGDLAVTSAFELARRLRKAPRAIAQEIAAALGSVPGVSRVEVASNGYLNFYLDRPSFVIDRLAGRVAPLPPARAGKTIVEHTAINPNKAAHIGHLRNAALGDTLVRALGFQGVPVEVQNYIDDTGVQVADVIVGFRELEGKTAAQVAAIADTTRFDYYCWDLYARVTEWYGQDKAHLALRAGALHEIEQGTGETAAIGRLLADRIVRCHLKTMARMNVGYQLLTWESDILHLQFWARAFEVLKETGAVHFQTQGRLAGCWVMPIRDLEADAQAGATEAPPDGGVPTSATGEVGGVTGAEGTAEDVGEEREKVIVRSNGTVTYVGKDLAYQFWKFGVLGRDFHYRIFSREAGNRPLWATSQTPTPEESDRPAFGAASAVYNVIDVRQSYLQQLLKQGLAAVGHPSESERSCHFSYEMVALSHATARQLGYALTDEDLAKPFVEVSGRKGLGVKADDLFDFLIEKAEAEVSKRNAEFTPAERRRVGEIIAVAAVRYFMVKFSRTKVIAFDIDEALNFEGESGPYLQYAVVRANNIFQKLRDREGLTEADVLAALPAALSGELAGEGHGHDLWALVLESARLDEVVDQAVRTLEFAILAKWAFGLAQMFNAFYHRYPILNEEQADIRHWRAAGVSYFRVQLARALEVMGIEVPPRM